MTADPNDADIDWGSPAVETEWVPPWDRSTGAGNGLADVTFVRVATDPRAMLADRTDARLLVVGQKPVGHLEALLTGSTTEWLLHHPPAPLAVIRTPDVTNRVVCCVDGSDHAITALHSFARLPLASGTDVTLLAVRDGRSDPAMAIELAGDTLAEHGMDASSSIIEGKPAVVILDFLERHHTDLVVLGTRGLTGWQRLRLGSTAAAVVRAAECSSLVSYEPRMAV
ncbi:hypothetical protein BH23ACT5_BH23ACT5_13160 [soil metagenome]